MPSEGTKRAALIGGIAAVVAFAFAGKAKADDEPVGPPAPEPPPDIDPIPGFVPDDDEPLPPKPPTCNYSGCGPQYDNTHKSPAAYALRLQQLGYPLNPAAPGFSIVSDASRHVVGDFQRHFNKVRLLQTVDDPPPPALAVDTLIGNRTDAAIERAHAWVIALNLPWSDLVDMA